MTRIFAIGSQLVKLEPKSIVVVFDYAIYSKALKIQQKHQEKFGFVEFKDVALESGIITVGSVGTLLDRKEYKGVIWFHKLMHETCLRYLSKGWLTEAKPTEVILVKFGASIEVIS